MTQEEYRKHENPALPSQYLKKETKKNPKTTGE